MEIQPPVFILGTTIPEYISDIQANLVSEIAELPHSSDSILLINQSNDEQDCNLSTLHGSRQFWSWQIYVNEKSLLSSHLSDGIWPKEQWAQHWHVHQQRLSLIANNDVEPMLAWLWLGENRRLMPLRQSEHPSLYRYPLLESYLHSHESPYGYLVAEVIKGHLESEDLIDRIRQCPQCNSGHLNYLETCPSCASPDIEERISLHCFTCGHVGHQNSFSRKGKLECPNCLTQVRHIGVDYDRPLETYHCLNCDHNFVEAPTKVRCLDCGSLENITSLITRKVSTFKVGFQASYTLRYGQQLSAPELALTGKVDSGYFRNLLVWLNRLAHRHQQNHLLLGLHLPRLDHYGHRFGEVKMYALTDQISERLNGIMRDTDICCQYRPDLMILLMPMTHIDTLQVLKSKIEQMAQLIDEADYSMGVYAWSLPDQALNEDAEIWLQQCILDISDD